MKTTESVAVARKFDEAGYDGIVTSDHMIYPRELSSPYPDSPTGKPGWSPDTAWPESWVLTGAMAAVMDGCRLRSAWDGCAKYELMGQNFDNRGKRLNEPILCGGQSDAALGRAARLCDGWVGYAYVPEDAVDYAKKLTALRKEYGRENEPFEILLALLDLPSPDLYKRAEDAGITAVMGSPWAGLDDMGSGDVERFRAPIERFAATIIAKVR